MKRIIEILFSILFLLNSCKDDDNDLSFKQAECRIVEEEIFTIREPNSSYSGEINTKETFQYIYDNNRLIEKRYINKKGEFEYWFSFDYNKNNELNYCVIHTIDLGESDTLAKYLFNNNKLTGVQYFGNDNIYLYEDQLSYPDSKTITYSSLGYEWDYTIDPQGNLVEIFQTKRPNENNSFMRAEYKYDNGKNPYKGLPNQKIDFREYFSESNLISTIGWFSDSSQVNDTTGDKVEYLQKIRYNNSLYPIEIIEGEGSQIIRKTIITYECF